MLFASMGLFAQNTSKADVPQKEKVCTKKCDKMKKAPMRQTDVRKTSVKTGNGHAVAPHKIEHKGNHVGHKHGMMVPLCAKKAKPDAKM